MHDSQEHIKRMNSLMEMQCSGTFLATLASPHYCGVFTLPKRVINQSFDFFNPITPPFNSARVLGAIGRFIDEFGRGLHHLFSASAL